MSQYPRHPGIESALRDPLPPADPCNELGESYATGEVLHEPAWRTCRASEARARDCEVCGQPSIGVWCDTCTEWGEQVAARFDPLAGFDPGEPET